MTMKSIQVTGIKVREVNTKRGLAKAYDLLDTAGNKVGFGFQDPAKLGITIGTQVTGDMTTDKYGDKFSDPKAVTVGPSTVPISSGSSSTGSDSTTGSSASPYSKREYKEKVFPVPPTHGDMAIIRQNALSNATSLVSDYVATLPAEKFPDLTAWTDLVIDVAYKFTKFSSGHREQEALDRLAGKVSGVELTAALEGQLDNA